MIITQTPKYKLIPVYSPIIFVVEDNTIVANKFNVKFIAEVSVAKNNISTAPSIITLKVTPNGKGVGIFDFSSVLQSYVESENQGSRVGLSNPNNGSAFKGTIFSDENPHSLHTIDTMCTNEKSLRLLRIIFKVQYSNSILDTPTIDTNIAKRSDTFFIYNGTLQEEDILKSDGTNFGYDLDAFNYIPNDTDSKFLTDCPTTQTIGSSDYHTLAFFNNYEEDFVIGGTNANRPKVSQLAITVYTGINGTGTVMSSNFITNTPANGGKGGNISDSNSRLIFAGVGTGNFKNTGAITTAGAKSYIIVMQDDRGNTISKNYIFNIDDDNCKGFEKIRLTWLNRHGAWDYFNFTRKNTRNISTNRVTYKQLSGSWNESVFRLHGYKGGRKTFRANAKESITLNTDYMSEAEAIWFEQLFTSPEVYILNEFSSDTDTGYLRKYVQPVVLTSQTYTRKTKANDNLIQYTVEIERSKNRVIQNA
jgi:hypothetical protein